jgi:hypothetical protein
MSSAERPMVRRVLSDRHGSLERSAERTSTVPSLGDTVEANPRLFQVGNAAVRRHGRRHLPYPNASSPTAMGA